MRRRGDFGSARSLYRLALRILSAGHRPRGSYLPALMGLGLNYQEEAKAQLVAGIKDLKGREPAGEMHAIASAGYRALRAGALRTFWLAKSCNVLALDLALADEAVHVQANQVANIAGTERLMGNLDTALCYARWAGSVHERLGQREAAAIDANLIKSIARTAGRAALKEALL